MKRSVEAARRASAALAAVAGSALVLLMLLTVADVVLRLFGRPIPGTYELVALGGSVAAGLSVAFTSWARGHIYVDSFVDRLPGRARSALNIATRTLGLILFFLIGWNLIRYGIDLRSAGEVTPTLRMPFYPVIFGLSIGCFVQCLVAVAEVVLIVKGEYE